MITICYSNSSLVVMGHANFAKKNDIVCAAISGIIYGAMSWFAKKEVKITVNKEENKISIELIKFKKKKVDRRIFFLVKQLKTIQQKYKKYIIVVKKN